MLPPSFPPLLSFSPSSVILNEVKNLVFRLHGHAVWGVGSRIASEPFSPHPGPLPQGEREHALLSFPRKREFRDDAGHVHGVSVVSPPSSVSPPFSVILNEVKKLVFRWHGHAVWGVGSRVASEPCFPSPRHSLSRGEGAKGLRTASRPAWAGSGSERMLPFTPCFRRGCPSQALHFRPPPKGMPRR